MIQVLIYREDLHILLLEIDHGLVLPKFEFNSLSEVESGIQTTLGFFVTASGVSFEEKVIVRRHFGPLNVAGEWVSIAEAAEILHLDQRGLTEKIDEDIGFWHTKQLQFIKIVFEEFAKQNIPLFLWGGWGVDFLLGRITRPHIDIDTYIYEKDKEQAIEIMTRLGFTSRDKQRKLQNNLEGVQFDCDYIEPRLVDRSGFLWGKELFALPAVGRLQDIEVTVVNPQEFLKWLRYKHEQNKSGEGLSGPTDKTLADIRNVEEWMRKR